MSLGTDILLAAYFFIPAYIANMTPVFIRKWNVFSWPLSKKLFGAHKTWRGLIFGVFAAVIVAGLQDLIWPSLSVAPGEWPAIGFLLGFGALAGDAVKSFFKRKAGVKPGGRWIPWDQIDYIIGALLLVSIVHFPGWNVVIILLIISFIGHFVVSKIGYAMGIRRHPW